MPVNYAHQRLRSSTLVIKARCFQVDKIVQLFIILWQPFSLTRTAFAGNLSVFKVLDLARIGTIVPRRGIFIPSALPRSAPTSIRLSPGSN